MFDFKSPEDSTLQIFYQTEENPFYNENKRKKKQKATLSLNVKVDSNEGVDFSSYIKSESLDPEEKFIRKQKIETIRLYVTTND